jgi:hypothetical protein
VIFIVTPLSKKARYWWAAILVGVVQMLFLPSNYQSYRLEKYGSHTVGTLLGKDCSVEKNQKISYQFVVDGQEFRGAGEPGAGNVGCRHFEPGDQVFITYLAENPAINVPAREASSHVFALIVFSLLIYGFLVYANGEQARFRREKLARKSHAKL